MPPRSADHLRLVQPAAGPSPAAGTRAAATRPAAARPKAAAERRMGDWLWHGLGAAVATGSAGFATYALIFSTGEVVPSGNFNLFGHYDRTATARAAQHAAPDLPAGDPAAGGVEAADRGGVDFAPTGSLSGPGPAGAASPAQAGTAGPGAGGGRRGSDGPVLPAFTLRDVFDGKALVESRASLSVVKPGSVLDGAGEVLSIEKRGEHWVVLTRNGVIAGQRR